MLTSLTFVLKLFHGGVGCSVLLALFIIKVPRFGCFYYSNNCSRLFVLCNLTLNLLFLIICYAIVRPCAMVYHLSMIFTYIFFNLYLLGNKSIIIITVKIPIKGTEACRHQLQPFCINRNSFRHIELAMPAKITSIKSHAVLLKYSVP